MIVTAADSPLAAPRPQRSTRNRDRRDAGIGLATDNTAATIRLKKLLNKLASNFSFFAVLRLSVDLYASDVERGAHCFKSALITTSRSSPKNSALRLRYHWPLYPSMDGRSNQTPCFHAEG
jgi:hypothetical protein